MAALEKLKTAQTLDRWVAVFKTAFKGAFVDSHEGQIDAAELARMSVKLPAVFISALAAPASTDNGDDTMEYDTVFSAYILTGGEHRDITGLNMSEVARVLVKNTQSNIPGVARPKNITWQNVVSTKQIGQGVSLNAVAWRQQILLGEQSTDTVMFTNGLPWTTGEVPSAIYLEHEEGTAPLDANPPAEEAPAE